MTMQPHRLFCFGLGYSAQVFARACMAEGWSVAGTCQSMARRNELSNDGIKAFLFDGDQVALDDDGRAALMNATYILSSVPPGAAGDAVLAMWGETIASVPDLRWVGYLSTTGVYGDSDGRLIDETAPINPTTDRSRRRAAAEDGWLALYRTLGVPVHIFRLAGIYGPHRSPLDKVRGNTARRISKPGYAASRIHVDDIAAVLRASVSHPRAGAIYNVCDDAAAPPADVTAFACELLGVEPPPEENFEDAVTTMSAMAASFWGDNRRVDNALIKQELGVQLQYPDYKSGLRAIFDAGA